jgi:hypothetical protein
MATTNLIQYTQAGQAGDVMNRQQVETLKAKEAIAAGDWVAFDYAATADGDVTLGVYKADGNSTPVRTPVGVALDAVGAEELLRVCISGVCNALVGDNGGAGNAIGTLLQITTTAGEADLAAAGSAQPVCGVLAEVIPAAAGATIKRVVVRKSF